MKPTLHPELAKTFVEGSLERIKTASPELYPFIVKEIQARYPNATGLGDFSDIFSSIASNMGTIVNKAVDAAGTVLINRENAKTAGMIAKDQAQAQIDAMNAQLKMQAAQTQNQIVQQELQKQQLALLNTGSGLSGVGLTTWLTIGIATAGLLYTIMSGKRGARR